jgi:PhzF family phenazine biosynthesis protein
MSVHAFRIVNVFAADEVLSGNPLCVFEDGRGLSDARMLALAVQSNLSETTSFLPSDKADARVRIFSPGGEFPFAGHPTLGTAAVVRERTGGERPVLEMIAGLIPVQSTGDVFTLTANAPRWREPRASTAELAALLGLDETDIGTPVLRMNTGMEQLLVPLRSEAALRRARPDAALAGRHANDAGVVKIYCWAPPREGVAPVRFFFDKGRGALAEDPGTGSAAANLGGWLCATTPGTAHRLTLHQGDHLGRACRIGLEVSADGTIRVSGRVAMLGRGTVDLPAALPS